MQKSKNQMRLFSILLSVPSITDSGVAEQLATQLIGKSMIVSWSERVTENRVAEGRTQYVRQSHTINLYLGSRNHVFSTFETSGAGAKPLTEAYPVDSGSPRCSVLSGGNRAAARTRFDGRRPFACAIPEGLL